MHVLSGRKWLRYCGPPGPNHARIWRDLMRHLFGHGSAWPYLPQEAASVEGKGLSKTKNQHRINLLYLLVGCNNYKV